MDYWNKVSGQLGEVSEDLKNLYFKMVCFNPEERPTIEEILKDDPWMKEVMSMNETELKDLEKEVYNDFKEREVAVIASHEVLEAESGSDISLGDNRGIGDDVKEYFANDLNPKYYQKTGFNMNNYMKINGNLKPAHFMNLLANKIESKYSDNCRIEADAEKLKFKAVFEKEEEEEEEENEENKKIEEQLDKLGLEDIDEFEDTIEKKDSVIQVKLLQSMNGGYLVKFDKKGGEIEDYHDNLKKIVDMIKQII